ncbi:MAG: BlaI/MecI/CopY family transcriptional regulator, partial [Clostridia bacterium]
KRLAEMLLEQVGWSKTTTYTVIKKCLDKGAIARSEPGFICKALISREAAQTYETDELVGKLFDGSPDLLVASLLSRKTLTPPEIAKLRALVDHLK